MTASTHLTIAKKERLRLAKLIRRRFGKLGLEGVTKTADELEEELVAWEKRRR